MASEVLARGPFRRRAPRPRPSFRTNYLLAADRQAVSLSAEDSLAILQLIAAADNCASTRDVEGYVDLFTEDGIMTCATGTAIGRAAVESTVAAVWFEEPSGALHLTLNPRIDETEDEPVVHSVTLIVIPGESPRMFAASCVRQAVRLTPAGWRIAISEILSPA